jgi:uncharacterized Zn finger protein
MKADSQTRFDIDTLREIAGEKVFARGEAYHRDGQVQILVVKPDRVLAQVAGSEDYRTQLTLHGGDIDGDCTCRAFEDDGFCKHMVATALAANDFRAGEADGGALARIRDHLKQKGVDALVDMIVGLVEQDPALFRKLDAAASVLNEDDKTLGKRLRAAIDKAVRTKYYVDYREAPSWAASVNSVLDTIAGLAPGNRAGLALELADRAIDRIAHAFEQIDDSDGDCGALLVRARDIHHDAARVVRPEPLQLARNLFAREMVDDFGTFDGTVGLYADVLGESGLAEYHRLAREAWEKSTPSAGGRGQREVPEEISVNHHQLMRILDFFAERDVDIDARIALRAKDLSSPWSYLRLAEFCLSQGRDDAALRHAEEGLWMFEDGHQDEQLVLFAAERLAKAGRKQDAEVHLWRVFEKGPTLELYTRLRELGGDAARERVVAFLERKQPRSSRASWDNPADLLIQIWMHEKMFDAAWAAARKPGASTDWKDELAEASEATHPHEALEVYAERVIGLVNSGGNSAYAEAAELIAHMATLRGKKEQADYVLTLKARFDRKRNFMKLLG